MLYPSHYKTAFAFSDLSLSFLHGPALRSACHALHMAESRLFHVPRNRYSDNLGGTRTPVALRSRAGNYETCNLATHANTRKHACDLIAPVGLPRLTALQFFD